MYSYRARVEKVIDGDTFEAVVDLGFHLACRHRFRLMGYNAPESRGPEKAMGAVASEYLATLLQGMEVTLRTHKGDAFGRWLADVTLPSGADLAEHLIANGLGVAWDGRGARPSFDPAIAYPLGSR